MENIKVALFQDIAERIDEMVFAFDINSKRFLYLSSSCEKLLHLRRESMINAENLFALVHVDDKDYVSNHFEELLAGNFKKNIEFRVINDQNIQQWLCITSFFVEKFNGVDDIIVGYAEEITSKKEHDDVLSKFANKKNSILSIISQGLFGPLGAIKALSSILAKKTSTYKDKDLDKLIGLIDKLSTQSITLIKEFINQEFLESVQVSLVKDRVNIVSKVREVIEMYQELEPELNKKIALKTTNDEILLEIDLTKFIQVINNLVSNAFKFTPEGGLISITIEDQEHAVQLRISDTGIGIPKKFHANLFDKFTEARRTGLNGEPSIGLGMSIIKTIIEWHKGKIWFESEENQGSTFFISLPKD